jgi:hypothetical protein
MQVDLAQWRVDRRALRHGKGVAAESKELTVIRRLRPGFALAAPPTDYGYLESDRGSRRAADHDFVPRREIKQTLLGELISIFGKAAAAVCLFFHKRMVHFGRPLQTQQNQ